MTQEQTLPAGWMVIELADLVSSTGVFSDGDWVESKDQDPDGEVRLVQLADIGEMVFLNKSRRYMAAEKADTMKCLYLQKGDVLISRLGDPLGKACIYPANEPKAVTVVDVCVFRSGTEWIDHDLVGYFLNSPSVRSEINSHASGTTRKRITGNKIKSVCFRLPPFNEQQRIVSKIEELFSDLDAGEASLGKVQKLLATYRQSVLKAAVTGELTKDWRETNRDRLESGEALLQRILTARREQWRGRGKYQEPQRPDTRGLPEMPWGWVWTNIEQVCFVETGATPKKGEAKYYASGVHPWVTSTAVNQKYIDEPQDYITDTAIKETNVKLFPIGTLILAMYGEGKTRGKTSELRIMAATNQACAALLCGHIPDNCKKYLKAFLFYNYETIRLQSSGGVQPNLNLSIVKETIFPFPSEEEQVEIVSRLDHTLSQIDALETWCATELKRSGTLRQSILKAAFSGQLVAQDPTNEPASVLLERIRAERQAAPARRGRRPRAEEASEDTEAIQEPLW